MMNHYGPGPARVDRHDMAETIKDTDAIIAQMEKVNFIA